MRYPIENYSIEVGDITVKITGFANYEIEKGFAIFSKVRILDWEIEEESKRWNKEHELGFTKDDIKALEESILNELNENYELCDFLANDINES